MLKEFNKQCWNTFIPDGSAQISSLRLPVSELRTLSYKVGSFVKRDALFVKHEMNATVVQHNIILLSYKLKGDTLICINIVVDNSLEMNMDQQKHADYLVQAFGSGKLTLETYRNHKELLSILERDAKSIMTSLETNSPPLLHSYHPHHMSNNIRSTLLRVDICGRKLASARPNKFESSVVQERVFKAEHRAWWSAFMPGSRVTYLPPSLTRPSEPTCLLSFSSMDSVPHTSIENQEIDSAPGGSEGQETDSTSIVGNGMTILADTLANRFPMKDIPILLEYPVIPIPHDPERVQKLLKLAAQLLT